MFPPPRYHAKKVDRRTWKWDRDDHRASYPSHGRGEWTSSLAWGTILYIRKKPQPTTMAAVSLWQPETRRRLARRSPRVVPAFETLYVAQERPSCGSHPGIRRYLHEEWEEKWLQRTNSRGPQRGGTEMSATDPQMQNQSSHAKSDRGRSRKEA